MAERIGKFHVLNTLGAGAHSSILHVRRDDDGREYALKLVNIDGDGDKKFLDQAKHEFRVGQLLDHPSLVKVHLFETETDWRFRVKKAKLLIEYVPGETLDKVSLLRVPKLLRVLERVADGLVHMHARGVIHADLKPSNVVLGRGTAAKVIDYGLARVVSDPPKERVQGTPEYMAPETAKHKIVNERTDIYNFGAMAYRLATFKLPPQAVPEAGGIGMTKKTLKALLTPVGELNPMAPAELCDLIHRCLEPNATKRPERMSEVQGTLDRLADEAAAGGPEEE